MQFKKRPFAGVVLGAAAFMALFGAALSAQATEPIVGTWKLDPARSTYTPGPAPKSTTITVAPEGEATKVAIDTVNADGSPLKWGFTVLRDGKTEAPVTGNSLFDTVTATRESPTAGTNVYKKAGKVVMTTKVAIAGDGKSMTVTATGTDPKGQAVTSAALFTKQ
jgi:hypothetical protein